MNPNRRSFMSLLASLPFVGFFVRPAAASKLARYAGFEERAGWKFQRASAVGDDVWVPKRNDNPITLDPPCRFGGCSMDADVEGRRLELTYDAVGNKVRVRTLHNGIGADPSDRLPVGTSVLAVARVKRVDVTDPTPDGGRTMRFHLNRFLADMAYSEQGTGTIFVRDQWEAQFPPEMLRPPVMVGVADELMAIDFWFEGPGVPSQYVRLEVRALKRRVRYWDDDSPFTASVGAPRSLQ